MAVKHHGCHPYGWHFYYIHLVQKMNLVKLRSITI